MSIFDSIGDAFNDAANAVANAGKSVANAGESVAEKVSSATANGANLFLSGWKDIFKKNFQQGFTEVGFGMARCVGIPTPGITGDTYADIIGEAAKWSLGDYQGSGKKKCFSEYETHVKNNLARNNIPWTDSMDSPLKAGAGQMSWIDLGC